jgi:hypothetical protein
MSDDTEAFFLTEGVQLEPSELVMKSKHRWMKKKWHSRAAAARAKGVARVAASIAAHARGWALFVVCSCHLGRRRGWGWFS